MALHGIRTVVNSAAHLQKSGQVSTRLSQASSTNHFKSVGEPEKQVSGKQAPSKDIDSNKAAIKYI